MDVEGSLRVPQIAGAIDRASPRRILYAGRLVDPRTSPVVIVLFTLDGCGACAEYKPRFQKLAAAANLPIPVIYADADDPKFSGLADRLKVEAVPVTFVLRRPRGLIRLTGASTDAQITWLLNAAAQAART